MNDIVKWKCEYEIHKYEGDWTQEDILKSLPEPFEIVKGEGNLLMTVGSNLLWKGLVGTAITYFSNANAYIGVGDSNTAASVGQTDLQASSNKLRVAMDATYPQVGISGGASADNQIIFQATFASGQANFAWAEFAVFNASSSGSMLNRGVQAMGTKVSGNTWTLKITITLS